MQLFTFSDHTLRLWWSTVKQNSNTILPGNLLAKPIRRSMLIDESISSDNSRTLYESFDKENSRSFHVFASYNRAFFHSSFLLQASSGKEIIFKWNLIHFSEFKTTSTFSTYSDSSSWEVQSHKPHRHEKEAYTNLYQPIRRGMKMPKNTKDVQW